MWRWTLVGAATLVVAASSGAAGPGTTTRVSVDSAGQQANDHSTNGYAVSDDGRFVVMTSSATNLVAGDTNNAEDVFVHDRQTATTTRVSVDSSGAQANGHAAYAVISGNGRYVAWQSTASNLVAGDTNATSDIFVHDRQTATTTRVSVDSSGAQGNGWSLRPSLSDDGRYVAFGSAATNLVGGDTNVRDDIFVHDRVTGTTVRASVGTSGVQGDGASIASQISGNGRYVAFWSGASNLAATDGNFISDIFLRDLLAGTTAHVSIDSLGGPANGQSEEPRVSDDGRYVIFSSLASDLVAADANGGTRDLFIRDMVTGTTAIASLDGSGNQPATGSVPSPFFDDGRAISGDGRYVAFSYTDSTLVAGDTNGKLDVFVRDRQTGAVARASVSSTGAQGNDNSFNATISDDGRYVAFGSWASNLIAGDTNSAIDVFVNAANAAPDCSGLSAAPTSLWPVNHKFVAVTVTGASDPDGDPLVYSYAVTQDEPVNGTGDGDTAPDAQIVDGKLELRAERSGNGDGRVYSIAVTVADGQASCTATLTVSVPHSPKKPAVAGVETFDSFGT